MKKILGFLLAFITLFSLCACAGNWESVNLKDPIALPKDGAVRGTVLEQVKSENAIGVFTGKSGAYAYEWTIFGSDISEPKETNLGVQLSKIEDGCIRVVLNQTENFGFSAVLSIHLDEKWGATGATAYANGKAVSSVSVTGGDTTILNVTSNGTVSAFVIRPDELPEDTTSASSAETTVSSTVVSTPTVGQDEYLSTPQPSTGKDKYYTDPVPEGKPKPVEPENQEVDEEKTYSCVFSIECSTILNNLELLDPDKLEVLPTGGVILAKTTVTFHEGESVFDVLQRLCKEKGIHMEASWTPMYNSAYVEGIHNLYEFDCGALSGWMYKVNGWYPNYGCSRYQLKDGDLVEWRYTCDLGNDVGGGYAVGG